MIASLIEIHTYAFENIFSHMCLRPAGISEIFLFGSASLFFPFPDATMPRKLVQHWGRDPGGLFWMSFAKAQIAQVCKDRCWGYQAREGGLNFVDSTAIKPTLKPMCCPPQPIITTFCPSPASFYLLCWLIWVSWTSLRCHYVLSHSGLPTSTLEACSFPHCGFYDCHKAVSICSACTSPSLHQPHL